MDHLLPETFAARHGYAFVRVMAVDARSNLTVGGTVEKSMANRSTAGRSFLADWFTVAKASCFRGSFAAAVSARDVMAALRRHLESRGFALPGSAETLTAECMEAIVQWSRA